MKAGVVRVIKSQMRQMAVGVYERGLRIRMSNKKLLQLQQLKMQGKMVQTISDDA